MMKKRIGVTDAELAVLKVLWEQGPQSREGDHRGDLPKGAESEFAAVHSFLQRLERKGLVAHDGGAFVHLFSAVATPADLMGQELRTLVDRMGTGSIAPLILQLIDQKRLSTKEIEEIRKLLQKHSK